MKGRDRRVKGCVEWQEKNGSGAADPEVVILMVEKPQISVSTVTLVAFCVGISV